MSSPASNLDSPILVSSRLFWWVFSGVVLAAVGWVSNLHYSVSTHDIRLSVLEAQVNDSKSQLMRMDAKLDRLLAKPQAEPKKSDNEQ